MLNTTSKNWSRGKDAELDALKLKLSVKNWQKSKVQGKIGFHLTI